MSGIIHQPPPLGQGPYYTVILESDTTFFRINEPFTFTVSPAHDGESQLYNNVPVTITPHVTVAGNFVPGTLVIDRNNGGVFTFTPTATGNFQLSFTNGGGLANPVLFNLTAFSFAMIWPKSGDSVKPGQQAMIRYASSEPLDRMTLNRDGQQVLGESAFAVNDPSSSFSWVVPVTAEAAADYSLNLQDVTGFLSLNSEPFAINAGRNILVTWKSRNGATFYKLSRGHRTLSVGRNISFIEPALPAGATSKPRVYHVEAFNAVGLLVGRGESRPVPPGVEITVVIELTKI